MYTLLFIIYIYTHIMYVQSFALTLKPLLLQGVVRGGRPHDQLLLVCVLINT